MELRELNVLKILDQYINGDLNSKEIQFWAESIEGRDDIGFQSNELKNFIFELATPEINTPIDKDWANQWIIRLKKACKDGI